MTLYLKYRPQTIDELDLESVRNSLKNILKSGNIPHAFLFSGPKGTGKTSAARILAKVINCENLGKDNEPCNKCASCVSITKGNNIDVIELDAASNRGIDDIRNLKEGIYLSPASAKKKVYIIDEAHMLTLEAANAFLKTLEEPPDHVVFILATTNPEKLPETVISRLTTVNFTKATASDVSRQLNRVAKGESVKIDEKAIELIAKKADGSFRDAVKILENLSFKTKDIKDVDVEEMFPSFNSNSDDFFKVLISKDAKKNLEFIENLVQNGSSIKSFTEKVLDSLHKSLLAKNGIGEDTLQNFSITDVVILIELFSNAKQEVSIISQLPIEIAVVKFCGNIKEQPVKLPEEPIVKENPTEEKKLEEVEVKEVVIKVDPITIGDLSKLDDEAWKKLCENVREKNVSIEALLRAAKPLDFDGKALKLGVYYQFHKEHLEDIKNIQILENICKTTFGIDYIKITFQLIEKPVSEKKIETTPNIESLTQSHDKDIIDAAKEIFG